MAHTVQYYYLGMTSTILLNYPIKAEIWAGENQSDLRILLQL